MPGDGTKLDITTDNRPPARLLDITRLIGRAGRRPTGVDRVELAYLRHLPSCPEPLFALARTTLGYVLLDPGGVARIADRIEGRRPWGAADRLAYAVPGRSETSRRAETDLRRLALARCLAIRLPQMLARHLPRGISYLNVGHSNLTDRVLRSLRHGAGARVAVMIHDTIPLDFPQYQRPGSAGRFGAMLERVRANAGLVICNSADTRDRAEAYMRRWGPVPRSVVAHLGVPVPVPGPLPGGFDASRPWFVALGTIEPRKGHDLLLDTWDDLTREMGEGAPQLLICGARGWNNRPVFDRLDRLPPQGPVHEMPGLDDGAVAALLAGSRGLLFPSRAEGFGLPAAEAAALGVPVVCAGLPALREVMGDIPVYVDAPDRYRLGNVVKSLIKGQGRKEAADRAAGFTPPDWDDHFKAVLRFA